MYRCLMILLMVSFSNVLLGQELTYDFTGNITEITTNENNVIPDLEIGDSFSGFVTFDSNGWQQTVGTVSIEIRGVELRFQGPFIYGDVMFAPGEFYEIRIAGDSFGDIGDSTFSPGNFGPDLEDTDGSAGHREAFPMQLSLSEFESNIFRISGNLVATDNQISAIGELSKFYRSEFLLGDVNGDDRVDLLDVGPFVDLLMNGEFQEEADINMDDTVSLLDVAPFVELLSN